ncbi:uncharacterized protein AB675_2594 [Cyphellophora attinorum]|uniref:Uncharacterized protein n=1 Tax=Cyphellophora attinorum TaxID=1664694 RepID=A0A0N1I0T8_9EURO|nr:uncharacterized protein AB675_2594 [Phialophora attinorum]KPI45245.1 hypothetical protein AB675_2594 [Phialophora attinorum]
MEQSSRTSKTETPRVHSPQELPQSISRSAAIVHGATTQLNKDNIEKRADENKAVEETGEQRKAVRSKPGGSEAARGLVWDFKEFESKMQRRYGQPAGTAEPRVDTTANSTSHVSQADYQSKQPHVRGQNTPVRARQDSLDLSSPVPRLQNDLVLQHQAPVALSSKTLGPATTSTTRTSAHMNFDSQFRLINAKRVTRDDVQAVLQYAKKRRADGKAVGLQDRYNHVRIFMRYEVIDSSIPVIDQHNYKDPSVLTAIEEEKQRAADADAVRAAHTWVRRGTWRKTRFTEAFLASQDLEQLNKINCMDAAARTKLRERTTDTKISVLCGMTHDMRKALEVLLIKRI